MGRRAAVVVLPGVWKRQAVTPYLTRVTVPTLNVAGWWDQEDFYGPLVIYEALERVDTERRNHLVVGPWNHGGWNAEDGRSLGVSTSAAPPLATSAKRSRRSGSPSS